MYPQYSLSQSLKLSFGLRKNMKNAAFCFNNIHIFGYHSTFMVVFKYVLIQRTLILIPRVHLKYSNYSKFKLMKTCILNEIQEVSHNE